MASQQSLWEDFFKEAGIPSKQSAKYASCFCDNRMRLDMLDDLNKELLDDLGVKAIGDKIAILRHAKTNLHRSRKDHSSSPEILEQHPPITKAKVTEVNNKPLEKKSSNSISTESVIKEKKSTQVIEKAKPQKTRKTLSQRFLEYEEEAKRRKIDEVESVSKNSAKESPKQFETNKSKNTKSKGTVFTIQVPAKPPTNASKNTTLKTNPIKSTTSNNASSLTRTTMSPTPAHNVTATTKINTTVSKKSLNIPLLKNVVESKPSAVFKKAIDNIQNKSTTKEPVSKPIVKETVGSHHMMISRKVSRIQTSPDRKETSQKVKEKPKVTLVPAQGIQLQREKPASIFSRLEKPTKVAEAVKVIPNKQSKMTVFRRLGDKDDNDETLSNESEESTASVFSRLGNKLDET